MTCNSFRGRNGDGEPWGVFICNRGERRPKCSAPGCAEPAFFQCDYPLKTGRTCDKNICATHRAIQHVATLPERVAGFELDAETVDFCLPHARIANR